MAVRAWTWVALKSLMPVELRVLASVVLSWPIWVAVRPPIWVEVSEPMRVDGRGGDAADLGGGEVAEQVVAAERGDAGGVEAIDLAGGQAGERGRLRPPSVVELRLLRSVAVRRVELGAVEAAIWVEVKVSMTVVFTWPIWVAVRPPIWVEVSEPSASMVVAVDAGDLGGGEVAEQRRRR